MRAHLRRASIDEPELLAEMDRMLERAVRVARGGDLPGALTLLAELHGRAALWWEPGSDDVDGGRRVVRVRRQLFLLRFARGELEAALEVGRLAVGSADLVLQAVDRAGSRPPDIVDEAVWAVLDQVPAVLATGDRALAAWLLDRAQQWSVPGPAERPRRVHGRVVHDRAAFLWGQMREPAPADRALAEQHVRRVFETAATAVGIRRELRDPSDPATVRDLASSLLQAAEITTAVMTDPASGVEALSLAAAELQALPDGQLAVDVLMETPDLRNTDIPPRMEAPDLPDRAALLARALEDIVPQVVARQRRAGPWPRLKP